MSDSQEITTDEAAEILGVSARHVLWYHANDHLPGRRIGARLLVFKRKDVEKLAANKPKRTGRPPKAEPVKPATKRKKKGGKA